MSDVHQKLNSNINYLRATLDSDSNIFLNKNLTLNLLMFDEIVINDFQEIKFILRKLI